MFVHSQKTEVEKSVMQRIFSTNTLNKLRSRLQRKLTLTDLNDAKRPRLDQSQVSSPLQRLPNEILEAVFGHLDKNSLLNARLVCTRWADHVEGRLKDNLPTITASRLTVSFERAADAYRLAWCRYGSAEAAAAQRALLVRRAEVAAGRGLALAFRQLRVQRVIFDALPAGALDDAFVEWLCAQLAACREFAPARLALRNVDMGGLGAAALRRLLLACAPRLEVLDLDGLDNVAPGLITDEHVLLLGHSRVRRLSIQFEEGAEEGEAVQVGDTSLAAFAERRLFPSFTMGRCMVTAPAVCAYVLEWLKKVESSDQLKSHALNLSDCPRMDEAELERQCAQLGLTFRRSVEDVEKFPFDSHTEGTLVTYAVHARRPDQVFQVNLFTSKN